MTEPNKDPKVAQAADKVVDAAADAIKVAAKAEGTKDVEAKQKAISDKAAKAQPKAYTADRDVYVDNLYTKAGEVFVTSQPKGEGWTERKPAEVAAIEASTNLIPDQASLEAASVDALQALCLFKGVNIAGIANKKAALIDAYKAANEPRL